MIMRVIVWMAMIMAVFMRMAFMLVSMVVLVRMAVFRLVRGGDDDMEFRPADARPADGLAGERKFVAKPQPRKMGLELRKVSPGVEKGADNHVASRPGKTIKIRYTHNVPSSRNGK